MMTILRLIDKSCLVHHHLIKTCHTQRMLSHIKYASTLTKYSPLLSTWLTAAKMARFPGVGSSHHLLSPPQLQILLKL